MIKSGFEDRVASGVVITGGSVIMEGMPELAEQVFNMPVRRGTPRAIGGLVDVVRSPMYATGVGLVIAGSKGSDQTRFKVRETNIYSKVKGRMKEWFGEIF
jgi:cell division protein FtsA